MRVFTIRLFVVVLAGQGLIGVMTIMSLFLIMIGLPLVAIWFRLTTWCIAYLGGNEQSPRFLVALVAGNAVVVGGSTIFFWAYSRAEPESSFAPLANGLGLWGTSLAVTSLAATVAIRGTDGIRRPETG